MNFEVRGGSPSSWGMGGVVSGNTLKSYEYNRVR